MFGKVLIATDGSKAAQHAAVQAADLGILKGAKVELIGVLDLSSITVLGVSLMGSFEREALLDVIRDEHLSVLKESLTHLSVDVQDARVIEGPVHAVLAEESLASGADLIVAGRHGYGVLQRALMGSVSSKLLQVSSIPVLVVPEGPRYFGRGPEKTIIFVPLDFSAESKRALERAKQLARELPASLILFHAMTLRPALPVTSSDGGFAIEASIQAADKAYRERAVASLKILVDGLVAEGLEARWEIGDSGGPGRISRAAAEAGASLIVLSSHGRSGFQKLWLGSVAASVIKRSELPVLVIPAGDRAVSVRTGVANEES